MEKRSEAALIIFIKNPVKGKVKTRLAADLGDEKALIIYQFLCRHTRDICIEIPCTKYLYYSDNPVAEDDWDPDIFIKKKQKGKGLGERMKNAFDEVLGVHQKAVLIGSDCPGINPSMILESLELLNSSDLVLGPSTDGGYYLIGLKENSAELFENISWSTGEVLNQTIAKANIRQLAYCLLNELSDIDTLNDWNNWKSSSV